MIRTGGVTNKLTAMGRQETAALVERAKGGSGGALDALYASCASKLLPLIRLRMGRSLRSDLESRDILQAVLLKSFQRIGQFQGQSSGSLMAWLARIAENEIRDRADHQGRQRRDVAKRVPLDEATSLPQPVRSALSQVIETEEAERLERALESLTDSQREAILLRQFEELTFPEMAARLGKSEDACRMLFARAMTALTLRLSEHP
jgi:RNA polymerase sigma-70 factor (ECF subfamily)